MTTRHLSHTSVTPHKIRVSSTSIALACALSIGMTGCAVSPGKIQAQADDKSAIVQNLEVQAKKQHQEDPPLLRIHGNFLGAGAEELASSSLPERFRDYAMNFGSGQGLLVTVAENLRKSTGLAVRINPDVYSVPLGGPSGTLQFNSVAPTVQTPAAVATTPVSAPAANAAGSRDYIPAPSANASPAAASTVAGRVALPSAATTLLPLSFSGDLAAYLDQITGALGVSWDYAHGEIYIHRLSTRLFTLRLPTGSTSYHDDLNGSGSGTINSGSSSASGQGAAAFGSTATASVDTKLDVWGSVDNALKAIKSSQGQYAINPVSGTVVVTDTRDVLDRVASFIAHENGFLNTQVVIETRRIQVQLSDTTELGANLNLVYQKLNSAGNANWSLGTSGPATLTDGTTTTGGVAYNVLKSGSNTNGTTINAQALNQFGQVISDTTDTVVTLNRRPVRRQRVTDQAYLASTTPGTGSVSGTGSGVPGLNPGVVSYGSNLIITPTIHDNRQITLELSDTQSDLLGIQSVSTGSGVTTESISTPTLARDKASGSFIVTAGDSLVLVGTDSDSWNGSSAIGITGGSHKGQRTRLMQVLIVTPRLIVGNS